MLTEGENYSWAYRFIVSKHVKFACEIGSRDGFDAVQISKFFSCKVACFEPDPINFLVAEKNILESGVAAIELFNLALGNRDEVVNFYSVNPLKYENRGSSSLFDLDFSKRSKDDPDYGKSEVTMKIAVQMNRYESLKLPTPDLVAMDVEGAELAVLEGFGNHLAKARWIVLEASVEPMHGKGTSFSDLQNHLNMYDFKIRSIDMNYWIFLICKVFKFKPFLMNLFAGSVFNVIFERKEI